MLKAKVVLGDVNSKHTNVRIFVSNPKEGIEGDNFQLAGSIYLSTDTAYEELQEVGFKITDLLNGWPDGSN